MTDPRFPIGRFEWPAAITAENISTWVAEIAATPTRLREAVKDLNQHQLDTPYREGGWTVRQVIHHVPDSHMNSYVRFKLALTETEPTIKPYDEAAWAILPDSAEVPVEVSLCLLDCLHTRWVCLLEKMTTEDWNRCLIHPELGRLSLDKMAALYAW